VGQLGSGPIFQRMWDLYLAYCQGRFRAGYLDVRQLLLGRGW
jgi:cyclopropane-fatty-acyl-phospholipid synthase